MVTWPLLALMRSQFAGSDSFEYLRREGAGGVKPGAGAGPPGSPPPLRRHSRGRPPWAPARKWSSLGVFP